MVQKLIKISLAFAFAARAAEVDYEAALGLGSDDDACEDGDTECSLQLRQLRVAQVTSDVHQAEPEGVANPKEEAIPKEDESHADNEAARVEADFGPMAQGVNLWQEQTWGDVVELIQANMSFGPCNLDSGGTCSVFSCAGKRGATDCLNGRCMCKIGHCAKAGSCYPIDASHCPSDTGGSCVISWCHGWRGQTECKRGSCICKTGGCAYGGKCMPVADTGATCSYEGCASKLGAASCHRGRCLCQQGHVAVGGVCQKWG